MGWLRLVGSFKSQVSFAKEPYKRDYILLKSPIISRSLLIIATQQLGPTRLESSILPLKGILSGEGQLFGALLERYPQMFLFESRSRRNTCRHHGTYESFESEIRTAKSVRTFPKRAPKSCPSPERLLFEGSILLPNLLGTGFQICQDLASKSVRTQLPNLLGPSFQICQDLASQSCPSNPHSYGRTLSAHC